MKSMTLDFQQILLLNLVFLTVVMTISDLAPSFRDKKKAADIDEQRKDELINY